MIELFPINDKMTIERDVFRTVGEWNMIQAKMVDGRKVFEIKAFSSYCALDRFQIHGMDANVEDFGSDWDDDPENAPDYGCGNRVWERNPATTAMLNKYNITLEEYNEICDKLEADLSFGCCGLCE